MARQRDPFSWAEDYNRQMTQAGLQDEQAAQNALMRVFATEASRQRPWSDLPVDLARQNNAMRNNMLSSAVASQFRNQGKVSDGPLYMNDTMDMIKNVATELGFDPATALAIAHIETGGRFDPKAKNPKSTAYGLFQQLDSNWSQYGKGMERTNPEHQTRAGLKYANDVIEAIRATGNEPTPGLIYIGYQQGPGAIQKMLKNLDAPIEQVIGIEAARLNGARRGESTRNFLARWGSKAQQQYARYSKALGKPKKSDEPKKRTFKWGDEIISLDDEDTSDGS